LIFVNCRAVCVMRMVPGLRHRVRRGASRAVPVCALVLLAAGLLSWPAKCKFTGLPKTCCVC